MIFHSLRQGLISLGALLLLTGASPLWSQEPIWVQTVSGSRDGETDFYDANSIRPSKRGVQVWLKLVFDPVRSMPDPNQTGDQVLDASAPNYQGRSITVSSIRERAEYSKDRKWDLYLVFYDASGKAIGSITNPPSNPGSELIPDSAECQTASAVRKAARVHNRRIRK